ncbi:DUF1284 domain-containing protein [Cognatishimia sp. SS12]|uniref:DUF1284 domain-containing protein n=1 Tax=Cognatishimia sp. SS12 TaxID=2979465 RepID=UPI00232B163A|nr:DUF1284 domain-containing protein [Cognatishimia sp. SS12]MDC0737407.1 DUF1284 domain-containing protein [Cognatishimia sp. SS12]
MARGGHPVRFRPHHFLCALGFQGAGYSAAFTRNMSEIVDGTLRAKGGEQTRITVTFVADSICTPCPERRALGCVKINTIRALDERHAKALGLKNGDCITWGEALKRIKNNVPPGSLSRLCQNCQWLSLGACEAALARLHAADGHSTAELPTEGS